MSNYEKKIENQLIYLLGKDSYTLNFIKELSSVGDLLFFGGSIRDICIFQERVKMPRDFDIAIKFKDKDKDVFNSLIENYNYRRNRFGGYKFTISNVEFDIWDLENTWAFKHTNLLPSEENLAKSVYLNIDGIVYNYNKAKLYDEIFRTSIEDGTLDITLEKNPQIELNLLRALVFKNKYNLNLSNKLKSVFNQFNNNATDILTESLYELQFTHYNKEHFSKKDIKKELQYI